MAFLRSKFYPVDINNRIIYNTPKKRAWECEKRVGIIATRGSRLNKFDCYKKFLVLSEEVK